VSAVPFPDSCAPQTSAARCASTSKRKDFMDGVPNAACGGGDDRAGGATRNSAGLFQASGSRSSVESGGRRAVFRVADPAMANRMGHGPQGAAGLGKRSLWSSRPS
jgi:hypothetical protein